MRRAAVLISAANPGMEPVLKTMGPSPVTQARAPTSRIARTEKFQRLFLHGCWPHTPSWSSKKVC
jgi:hypothetical protein